MWFFSDWPKSNIANDHVLSKYSISNIVIINFSSTASSLELVSPAINWRYLYAPTSRDANYPVVYLLYSIIQYFFLTSEKTFFNIPDPDYL